MKLQLERVTSPPNASHDYTHRVTILDYPSGELIQMFQWMEENNLPYALTGNKIYCREKDTAMFMLRWSS